MRRTLKSDLAKVYTHSIRPREYEELPELTEEALSRAVVKKGGRPRSTNPRKLISIRLPVDVIEGQPHDLIGTEAQPGEQQQDGVISHAGGTVPIALG